MAALPMIPATVYTLTLPGSVEGSGFGKKVRYRPFTVREYKSLLKAQEFGDDMSFISTARNILMDCTFNEIAIDDLSVFYIDYLFLMIRSKSVGEMIEAQYLCTNPVPDPENEGQEKSCNTTFGVSFDLNNTFIKFPDDYHQKCVIELSDTIGMKLKSPSFSKFRSVGIAGKDLFDITDDYIFACVDCIYDGDKLLHPGIDFNLEELQAFIEQFSADKIDSITSFFKNQPSVSLLQEIQCPKCGNKTIIELNGVKDFFA